MRRGSGEIGVPYLGRRWPADRCFVRSLAPQRGTRFTHPARSSVAANAATTAVFGAEDQFAEGCFAKSRRRVAEANSSSVPAALGANSRGLLGVLFWVERTSCRLGGIAAFGKHDFLRRCSKLRENA